MTATPISEIITDANCTGCSACMNICPTMAISMAENAEGFIMPKVDASLCVKCGKCAEVCPVLHVNQENNPEPECYAFRANDEIRAQSSSGGFFSVIARHFIDAGGHVCGAVYDADFGVKLELAREWEDVKAMRGSKYVQAYPEFVYKKIKTLLGNGEKVLFTGTPCQVAGLRGYLGKPYENLLTVDLICHGVPPQKLLKQHLREVAKGRQIKSVNFRDKRFGWVSHIIFIEFKDGSVYKGEAPADKYESGFHRLLSLRKMCGNCPFCAFPRQADITIGDFWQYEKYLPDYLDDKGTSLIFTNTTSGSKLFAELGKASHFVKKIDCDIRRVPNRVNPWQPLNKARERFFDLIKDNSFFRSATYCLQDKFDIGLIGWYKNWNFGSSLTMLALYKVLTDMGYAVLMITPPEKPHSPYEGMKRFYEHVPYPPYALAPIKPDKVAMRVFNQQCNAFVTGSDQMFNVYCYRDVKGYVSQDWVEDSKKKIAYAVSFGHDRIFGTENERAEMAYFIQKFDGFSVREKSGVTICAEKYGVDAAFVMDPVFICPIEFYKELAEKVSGSRKSGKYVFCYILDPTEEKQKIVEAVCEKLDYSYVLYTGWHVKSGFYLTVSQEKFDKRLLDFINSDFVVTDSYHGVCLSIIFGKSFVAYANRARGYTRFESLLGSLELMNRLIHDFAEFGARKDLLLGDVDYDNVYSKLSPLVAESKQWLKHQLQRNICKPASTYDMAQKMVDDASKEFDAKLANYMKEMESRLKKQEQIWANKLQSVIKHYDNSYNYVNDIYKYINKLVENKNNLVVLLAVRDTPANVLDVSVQNALYSLGLKTELNKQFRQSYLAAIDCGHILCEMISNNHEMLKAELTIDEIDIKLVSASYEFGDKAQIIINGKDVAVNQRGINIAVIDKQTKYVLDSVAFDTWLPHAPAYRI